MSRALAGVVFILLTGACCHHLGEGRLYRGAIQVAAVFVRMKWRRKTSLKFMSLPRGFLVVVKLLLPFKNHCCDPSRSNRLSQIIVKISNKISQSIQTYEFMCKVSCAPK